MTDSCMIFDNTNIEYIKTIKLGDDFFDYVQQCVDSIGDSIAQVKDYEQSNDIEKLKFITHKMKGGLSIIGAEQLCHYCGEVSHDPVSHTDIADSIDKQFKDVVVQLKKQAYLK